MRLIIAMVTFVGNAAAQLPTTIQTKSGAVRGTGTDIVVFKGIPYAAPPTGGHSTVAILRRKAADSEPSRTNGKGEKATLPFSPFCT